MLNEQQQKWIKQTSDLFMRYGIKSITMDDVARELGISKKTLYQFVENKDDLVVKMLKNHIEDEKTQCLALHTQAANAIEEIMQVIKMNSGQIQQMKANIVYDLQRYHRDAWAIMQEFQRKFVYDLIRSNLERGMREELYRHDINVDVLTKIHIISSFQLFDESMFPADTYSKITIFREYLLHYLHGILSEKGRAVFAALPPDKNILLA